MGRGRKEEVGTSLVVQWLGSVLSLPWAQVQSLVGVQRSHTLCGVAKERWRGFPRRWRKISHQLSPVIGGPRPSSLAHGSCLEQG